MTTTTIGNIATSSTVAADADLREIEQGGVTKKETNSVLRTYMQSEIINAQTGTSYTFVAGDFTKLVTHSNAGAIADTLPQAGTSFPSGWWVDVQNLGAGTLTITPTTSTVDGASSLVLLAGQGCRLVSNGTNYFTGRGSAGLGSIATQNANALAVTGGSIDGTTIGATTASTGKFTTIQTTSGATNSVTIAADGGNAVRFTNAAAGQCGFSLARLGAAADEKIWEVFHGTAGSFSFRTLNDAYSAANAALEVTRTTGIALAAMALMPASGRVTVGTSTDNGTDLLQVNGTINLQGGIKLYQRTLTTLPSASTFNGYMINVTDATGGAKICMSDGTNWKIINTTTTVS